MPGVKQTKIGHLGRDEIVEVEYDPAQISLKEMSEALARQSSFDSLIVKNQSMSQEAEKLVPSSKIEINGSSPRFIEPKHSLRTQYPELYKLPLTEQQKIILNSWSYFGGEMPDVLTEEQKQSLKKQGGASYKNTLLNWLGIAPQPNP